MKKIIPLLLVLLSFLITAEGHALSVSALSEMLQTEFGKRNAFIMIERRKLSNIIKEQSLELAGIIENEASKIGQLAGADKIITGSLMEIDNKFVVLIKLIDVSSGQVDITEGIKVDNENKLEKGLSSIVTKIVKQGQNKWGQTF